MAAMADLGFPGELRGQAHIAESGIASRTRDWAYAPVNVASSLRILIGKVRNWDLSDQDFKRRRDIHGGICTVPSPARDGGLGEVQLASQLPGEAEIRHGCHPMAPAKPHIPIGKKCITLHNVHNVLHNGA